MYIVCDNGENLEYNIKVAKALEWVLERAKISPANYKEIFEYTIRFSPNELPEGVSNSELESILNKLDQVTKGNISWKYDRDGKTNLFVGEDLFVEIFDFKNFEAFVNQYLKLKDEGITDPLIIRHSVPKLFDLTPRPRTSIIYKGKNISVKEKQQNTHGPTQTYAILSLLAQTYEKKLKNQNIHNNEIKLSCKEIYDVINDPKQCNQQPDWEFPEDVLVQKSRLNDLKNNICKKVPFTEEELDIGTNENKTAAYFIFEIHS